MAAARPPADQAAAAAGAVQAAAGRPDGADHLGLAGNVPPAGWLQATASPAG